jgi:hypothetical protein
MGASELSKRYPKAPPPGYSTRGTTGEIILNFNRYVFQLPFILFHLNINKAKTFIEK